MSQTDVPYEPVLAPDSVGQRTLPFGARVAITALMPLFLMTTFVLCFVSAGHAPTPHDLALSLAGPTSQTSDLADQISDKADDRAFDITFTKSEATARKKVESRDAAGAIFVTDTDVTTYVASAGGSTQASLVKSVGAEVGTYLKLPVTITEVAPTRPKDTGGISLFFFLVVCTLGSYLTVTVLSQTMQDASILRQVSTVVVAAVLAPVIGFSIISGFVGDYGVSFGSIAAVLGIGMLYSFTIGMISILFVRLAGLGGTLLGMVFLVALNFPSSGGSTSEGMLPPFWQVVHNLWVGAGMLEWVRGILYFDGAQVSRWATHLLIWTVSAVAATAIVVFLQSRRNGLPERPIARPPMRQAEQSDENELRILAERLSGGGLAPTRRTTLHPTSPPRRQSTRQPMRRAAPSRPEDPYIPD